MNEAGVVFDAAVLTLELAQVGFDGDPDSDPLRADAISTLGRLRANAPVGRGARPASR